MTSSFVRAAAGTGAFAALFAVASTSFADNNVVVTPAPQQPQVQVAQPSTPVVVEPTPVYTAGEREPSYYGPNRALLTSGFIAFGGTYTASIIVAAESSHRGDNHLYIPVVGPWLDLGDRGGCPVSSSSCDAETGNKVLLILDGIFQGIGTLSVISSFLTPEHRAVVATAKNDKPKVHVTPVSYGRGTPGLAVLGQF